jgi:hypothetical protein
VKTLILFAHFRKRTACSHAHPHRHPAINLYFVLSANERVAVAISEAVRDDHDQVDECPDPEPAQCQELGDGDAGFFCVEAMDAEGAQKEAEEEGCQPVISLHAVDYWVERTIRGRWVPGCCSAIRAESRACGDISAAVRAIHSW